MTCLSVDCCFNDVISIDIIRANQEWTFQKHWQHWAHMTHDKGKQSHNKQEAQKTER